MTSVKQLFKINKGRKEDLAETDGTNSLRYIQIEDLRNDNNVKYCKEHTKNVIVEPKDIIIAWDGANAGTIGVGLNGVIGSTLAKMECKSDNVYPYYVAKFLQSKFKYLRENCTGATIPHISKAVLENLIVPLPPLQTQKKIAEVLDKAQELIDVRKQQIKLFDDLIQSTFYDMFGDPVSNPMGWEVKVIIDECSCIVPARDKPKSFTGNIPWITINDLNKDGMTYKSKENIGLTEEEINEVKRKKIPSNSVLMSCVGDLGITSINNVDVVINQQLHSFQCGDKVNSYYLRYLIPKRKDYLYKMATMTTVPYLNKTKCNNIPLMLPPIELQNEFAQKVQKIEQQKELMQKSLNEMENNFNSLMQRSFNGELFN